MTSVPYEILLNPDTGAMAVAFNHSFEIGTEGRPLCTASIDTDQRQLCLTHADGRRFYFESLPEDIADRIAIEEYVFLLPFSEDAEPNGLGIHTEC